MRYIFSKAIICIVFGFIMMGALSLQITNIRRPLDQNNLQFSNYTSSKVSPDMVKDYIEIINLSYSFFADDIISTTLWIQNQLNHKYDKKYNVIIITQNVTGGWAMFRQSYVQWTGVNKAKPQWVYLIYVSLWDKNLESTYVNSFIAGPGIDEAKQKVIRNVINNEEVNCEGNYASEITYELYMFDGQDWGIIVKALSDTRISGRFYNVKNQYYALASKMCEYLIFVDYEGHGH